MKRDCESELLQGIVPFLTQAIFYVMASISMFYLTQLLISWQHKNIVNTSVVGFVEACRFHHGEIEILPDKTICYYPTDMPKLYEKQK